MDKYSLNKKWFVPREENIEQEGFSTFQVLKQVLIHIKDHFQQLPGGKIDLNTVTMKVNHEDWTWLDIVNDLDDLAIFFEERVSKIQALMERERKIVMMFNKQYDKLRGED